MPVLSTHERTATKAAIKRGSARARASMQRLDRESRKAVNALYTEAVRDIQQIIFQHSSDTGQISPLSLKSAMDSIEQRIDQLTRASEQLVSQNLRTAANFGVDPFTGIAGITISTEAAASAAAEFTQAFIDNNGLNLSGRLWRLNSNANEIAGSAIRSAVVQGHSASRAAQDFINRGQQVPSATQRIINNANGIKVGRVFGAQLMRGEANPYAQALRVFRTEINRAHGEAYMVTAENSPGFGGLRYMLSPAHPRPDICDMHSSVNLFGLGAGVYPTRERCPWPAHPNILSFIVQVFDDEITDADRNGKTTRLDWLKEQPAHIQSGVLGGQRKALALRAGVLTEREITTPWRVLKKKYEKRGIDTNQFISPSVKITPRSNVNSITEIRQEAVDFVQQKGIETGFEFAVAYDINTGIEFIRKTSRKKNQVSFNQREMKHLVNPQNKIDLIHNHPSSSSLSAADLGIGTLPGVNAIVAAGHDGSIFRSVSLADKRTINRAGVIAGPLIEPRLHALIAGQKITSQQADLLAGHIKNSAISRAGLIEYAAQRHSVSFSRSLTAISTVELEKIIELVTANIIRKVLSDD